MTLVFFSLLLPLCHQGTGPDKKTQLQLQEQQDVIDGLRQINEKLRTTQLQMTLQLEEIKTTGRLRTPEDEVDLARELV